MIEGKLLNTFMSTLKNRLDEMNNSNAVLLGRDWWNPEDMEDFLNDLENRCKIKMGFFTATLQGHKKDANSQLNEQEKKYE